MQKLVTGLALFTMTEMKMPIAPKTRFKRKVFNERIRKELIL